MRKLGFNIGQLLGGEQVQTPCAENIYGFCVYVHK